MTFTESRKHFRYNYNPSSKFFNDEPDVISFNGEADFHQGSLLERMEGFQDVRVLVLQDDFRGLATSCLLPDYPYKRIK